MCKDPFILEVEPSKLNSKFKIVLESEGYEPARNEIIDIYHSYDDKDGNFIKDFQTTGFDSRIWELYIYKTFMELGYSILNEQVSPDFHIKKADSPELFIECTTSGYKEESSSLGTELSKYIMNIGSPLYSKLKRKYWDLEHVKGMPLIFAIGPFHNDKSLLLSESKILDYLFGRELEGYERDENGNVIPKYCEVDKYTLEGKTIDSFYFNYTDCENISAVLFSNSGTITKFLRMGILSGKYSKNYRDNYEVTTVVTIADPDPVADKPIIRKYSCFDKEISSFETYKTGLLLIHNPKALLKLNPDSYPDLCNVFLSDGQIVYKNKHYENPHTFSSFTSVLKI